MLIGSPGSSGFSLLIPISLAELTVCAGSRYTSQHDASAPGQLHSGAAAVAQPVHHPEYVLGRAGAVLDQAQRLAALLFSSGSHPDECKRACVGLLRVPRRRRALPNREAVLEQAPPAPGGCEAPGSCRSRVAAAPTASRGQAASSRRAALTARFRAVTALKKFGDQVSTD